MKTYNIGNERSLKLGKNNDEIIMQDNDTKNAAVFSWASFLLYVNEIIDTQP